MDTLGNFQDKCSKHYEKYMAAPEGPMKDMYKRCYEDALRMYTADSKAFEEEIGVARAKRTKNDDDNDDMSIE
jgi:hypothetical protein